MNTLKLPVKLVHQLMKLPESAMGYQLVKVILKNGKVLPHYKVLNSSMLLLEKDEELSNNDIWEIEIE